MEDKVFELEGVSRSFGQLRAVDNLTLSLGKGEVTGFLGTNGAGKTTTIKASALPIHLRNEYLWLGAAAETASSSTRTCGLTARGFLLAALFFHSRSPSEEKSQHTCYHIPPPIASDMRGSCKTRCGKGALALVARPRRPCYIVHTWLCNYFGMAKTVRSEQIRLFLVHALPPHFAKSDGSALLKGLSPLVSLWFVLSASCVVPGAAREEGRAARTADHEKGCQQMPTGYQQVVNKEKDNEKEKSPRPP
jgi:energy-coupling factor transporter ATP-binding protein EcfA2